MSKRTPGVPTDWERSRLLPDTLRGRMTLTTILVMVVLTTLLGTFFAHEAQTIYEQNLRTQLESQAHLLASSVEASLQGGTATIDPLVKRLAFDDQDRYTVIAADGTVLGESDADPAAMQNHFDREEVREARETGVGHARRRSATTGEQYIYVAVAIPNTDGVIARVSNPVNELDAAIARIRRFILVATLVAIALGLVVVIMMAQRITGPLEDLREQANAVASGRFDVTATPSAARELGEVALAFNLMTERIQNLVTESERSRGRLESIFETLNDGVVILDEHGVILGVNIAACRVLEIFYGEVVNQSVLRAIRDYELANLIQAALSEKNTQVASIELTGNGRIVEVTAKPTTSDGETLVIVVIRDVTNIRRAETVRREFVANVSHELRTPLASIKALVETLEAGAMHEPEVASDFLHRVVGEVDRLTDLVDELLDLARLQSGRMILNLERLEPTDVLTRGAERLRPQTKRARLDLQIEIPADLPPILVDRARVEQVLINLVHNAIKFTPAGGSITVSAELDGPFVAVHVTDTGSGIPEAELPRLFERFYKADRARRSEGTGLGLAIAKHIVQAHQGTISAESAPNKGARFTFTLPVARPELHRPIKQGGTG